MKKLLAAIYVLSLLVLPVLAGLSTQKAIAITCPDGSFLPDERADECPAIPDGCPGSDVLGPPAPGVECPGEDSATETASPSQPVDFDDDEVTEANDCSADVLTSENCIIIQYIVRAINILSALAGLAITASIIIAGYQYMTARDNSGQIEASRKRIIWALVALATLIFGYAFLNFIVPGGVL